MLRSYYKTQLFWVLWLCSIPPALAQLKLHGLVIDQSTRKPLAYVNIGIVGSPIGTLSNADGSFLIQVPTQYKSDSLLISHLGYTPQLIALATIYPTISIALTPNPIQLPVVRVTTTKKRRLYAFGNKLANSSFIINDTMQAGSAMALLIENKFPQFHPKLTTPLIIEKAAVQIYSNTFPEFKLRIRLLAWDSLTGLPGRDLLAESVLVTSQRQHGGWLEVELSAFDLRITQPRLFLVVEWILTEADRRSLSARYQQFALTHPKQVRLDTTFVDGRVVAYTHWMGYQEGTALSTSTLEYSLKNYQCYYRQNSQGAWLRSPHVLSARLFVSSQ